MAFTFFSLAVVYQSQGKYAEAKGLYRRVLAIDEKALGAGHPDVANTLYRLSSVYQARGKYAEAERILERALAIGEKALGKSHPNVAFTLYGLATAYQAKANTSRPWGFFNACSRSENKRWAPATRRGRHP